MSYTTNWVGKKWTVQSPGLGLTSGESLTFFGSGAALDPDNKLERTDKSGKPAWGTSPRYLGPSPDHLTITHSGTPGYTIQRVTGTPNQLRCWPPGVTPSEDDLGNTGASWTANEGGGGKESEFGTRKE